MKALRLLGLFGFSIVATAWTYVGVLNVMRNPTLIVALVFGTGCMFGFIVVALHKEVFK